MILRRSSITRLAMGVLLIAAVASPAMAQSWDAARLSTALIGRWEGETAPRAGRMDRNPPERTLIITSITGAASPWVADAEYGISGSTMSPTPVQVIADGPALSIQFRTGANSSVTLQLINNALVGSLQLSGATADWSMKLEKK
jgi:hypothetical protein